MRKKVKKMRRRLTVRMLVRELRRGEDFFIKLQVGIEPTFKLSFDFRVRFGIIRSREVEPVCHHPHRCN
jgi:hypothetical protein